ncbi:SRPBCC family protein [Mucilaginibacter puniceus]
MATRASTPIKQKSAHQADNINLNWPERYISIAAGVKLTFSGLKKLFSSPLTSILKLGAGGYLVNRGISGHCALYSKIGKDTQEPINVDIRSSFTIDKPRKQVYDFWRKLDNLPLFMNHLESVEVIDSTRSHWVLKLPTGVGSVSWDAEIVKDKPNEVIGWSSLPNSIIDNAGKVYFRDTEDGKGTVIDVVITYQPPAGGVGASIAHVLNPLFKNIVDTDVRNFKQYMDIDKNLKPITHATRSHKIHSN